MSIAETIRVQFRASLDLPKWRHHVASVADVPYAGTTTRRVLPPVIVLNGETFKATPWEVEWLVKHYPSNFVPIGAGPSDPRDPAFVLERCTYPQLQEAAKVLGVSGAGKEDVLRERIRQKLLAETIETPKEG